MINILKAYVGAQIHDGHTMHEDCALVVNSHGFFSIQPAQSLPHECPTETLDGGMITPGFVDLQVNGGGGVMFNDEQSVDALRTIAVAHAKSGTTAIMPTLITDTQERTLAAINAVERAISENVSGIVGIHLEGPHISIRRKGAHSQNLIRKMADDDLLLILGAANRLPNVMVTVAPEATSIDQIKTMANAGVIVSLGHTDANMKTCHAAFDAGACCVTHLFNAMSPLGNREPGLVGATLSRGEIYAGLIADKIHVHPTTVRIALDSKPNSDKIFLVTDAMATAGSSIVQFNLNGREVFRKDHCLTLADGTLAGADLNMPRAINVMVSDVGDTNVHAVRRATSTPTKLLREHGGLGTLLNDTRIAIYLGSNSTQPIFLNAMPTKI